MSNRDWAPEPDFEIQSITDDESPVRPAPPLEPPAYFSDAESASAPSRSTAPFSSTSDASSSHKGWTAFGVLAGIVILVVVGALASARHWTKVDVAEHKETFRTEAYQTGSYNISNDRVSPCYVGQDWTACINVMVGIYNSACVGVSLTTSGYNLCDGYLAEIDRMKGEGGWGYTVVTLGSWGHLSRLPETSTRQVSNNDYRPAVTHDAVCYLGFLGECK